MSDILKRLREPAALAALAYAGLSLLAAVIDFLFPPSAAGVSQAFGDRAFDDVGSFLNFPIAAALAIAVLLANDVAPPLARARLITLVALIEAGVAAVFGVICALALFGANAASGDQTFAQFLGAIGGGFVIAAAGWYAWLSWQKHAATTAPAQPAPNEWNVAPGQGPGPGGSYAPPYQAQPSSGQYGQGAAAGAPQQPAGAPPGGFGWTPQQQQQQPYGPGAAGGAQGTVPQQQFRGDDRTQMIQPVSSQPSAQGQQPYQAQGAQQAPQGGQNYQQPEAQPWSPGGASSPAGANQMGQQQGPQQQQHEQQQTQEQRDNPFGIGDWRSE